MEKTINYINGDNPYLKISGEPGGVIIVMADENMADQERVKQAARDCEVTHVFSSVYNGEQLINLLFKRDTF